MLIAIDARIISSTTGRYVERILHHLQEIDKTNEYIVLLLEKDIDFWKPTSDNFNTIVANFDQFSFSEQLGFKKLLDSLKPDLVHFCMPQQPILYSGKKVTTIHDLTLLRVYNSDKNWLIYHLKQAVGYFVFKRVIASNDYIITPSDFTKDEVIDFSKRAKGKITTTHLASDVSDAKSEPFELPFSKYIMYVGHQSDYKNIRRLASAHQRLLKKYPELGLVLVGSIEGSKNKSALGNKEYFEEKGYKNIVFTGFVSDEQLKWLYGNTSAYVFPSLMEGFGLPGLEAMGNGSPVVSSNATCLPEVYGDAAHYFNPTDVTDMAKSIDEVLKDEELRKKLIKNGYEQIKKYSWKKTTQQTHDVYMKVLENKD
jgi:glycosyltransferase involved in cell wall biosynthesis